MLVAGAVFLATLIINIIRRIVDVPDDVAAVLVAAKDLAPAAIPVALLIGFYRQSEHRLQAMVDAIPDRMFRFATGWPVHRFARRRCRRRNGRHGHAPSGADSMT